MRPTFKTPDYRKAIVEIEKQRDKVLVGVKREIKATAEEIEEKAKMTAPVNESALYNSISSKELSEYQYEIVANTKYAAFMEFGTRKLAEIPAGTEQIAKDVQEAYRKAKSEGKGGTIADMEKSIRRWVRLKGIVGTYSVKTKRRTKRNKAEEEREDSAVFLIMRKILRVGVKPQPFFFPSVQSGTRDLAKRLTKLIR